MNSGKAPGVRGRDTLRAGLGALWVLDGLLQLQPAMFSPAFYALFPNADMAGILQGTLDSQPPFAAALIRFGLHAWGFAPVPLNAAAAFLQLAVGAALLARTLRPAPLALRAERPALVLSIAWSLVVWVFGEGFGGIFTAGANYFEGAPGPALLYIAAALALLAPSRRWAEGSVGRGLRAFVGAVFLYSALLQALPSSEFWSGQGLVNVFANAAQTPQPPFLSLPIQVFALWTYGAPGAWNAAFAATLLVLGIAVLAAGRSRAVAAAVLLWTAWSWWFGQDFGGILGGNGTDPSSAPLVALLFLAGFLDSRRSRPKGSGTGKGQKTGGPPVNCLTDLRDA